MFNLIWNKRPITIADASDLVESMQPVEQVMPLQLQMPDNTWWLLPYEPLISISGENIVKMREVAKSQGIGTIKERWSEGDFKINVQGTFINDDMYEYTDIEVQKLREAITQKRAIGVQNEILQLLNINQIVVLSYDLPFSKGENVQNWSFEAVSDDSYNLFIEVK